jgi:hypothetical protein
MNVIMVPILDLRMSLNVITLTGTLLALCFGGLFTLLVKQPEILRLNERISIRSRFLRLLGKLR